MLVYRRLVDLLVDLLAFRVIAPNDFDGGPRVPRRALVRVGLDEQQDLMVAAPRRRSWQRSAALEHATALRETGPNMRIAVVVMLVTACGPVRPDDGQPGQPDGPTSPGSDAPGGGSGSGSDPLADYRSGTRIKMQVLTTPDGAKQFNGWFDTQRNESCAFQLASDGVTRCLPGTLSFSIFTDSTCTVRGAEALSSLACAVAYVAAPPVFTSACPIAVQFGAIFSAIQVNPTPTTVFTKSGTSCVATTVAAGLVVFVAGGPEIPPSSFQSATLDIE
jgi:hypothetical protein